MDRGRRRRRSHGLSAATLNRDGDLVGVDAALDYPLFDALKPAIKGFSSPRSVIDMYGRRKAVERDILSSHGDATRYFVTFLDNHDVKERLRHWTRASRRRSTMKSRSASPVSPRFRESLASTTEPSRAYTGPAAIPQFAKRFGAGPGFATNTPFYQQIAGILDVRANESALRYGRFYFRQLSGDGQRFDFSTLAPGVLAFSRILNDREVVVVANFSKAAAQRLHVIVDSTLSAPGTQLAVIYSNKTAIAAPLVTALLAGAQIVQLDGSVSFGACAAAVTLAPAKSKSWDDVLYTRDDTRHRKRLFGTAATTTNRRTRGAFQGGIRIRDTRGARFFARCRTSPVAGWGQGVTSTTLPFAWYCQSNGEAICRSGYRPFSAYADHLLFLTLACFVPPRAAATAGAFSSPQWLTNQMQVSLMRWMAPVSGDGELYCGPLSKQP